MVPRLIKNCLYSGRVDVYKDNCQQLNVPTERQNTRSVFIAFNAFPGYFMYVGMTIIVLWIKPFILVIEP